MLLTEWNTADAIAVNRREGREEGLEEGREEGLVEGLERGREEGLEEGKERGREEGLEEGRVEIAKNLKAAGISLDIVSQATGLSLEEIAEL